MIINSIISLKYAKNCIEDNKNIKTIELKKIFNDEENKFKKEIEGSKDNVRENGKNN
jgi:hypothetical protein